MTEAQKLLRQLLDRQSRERGKMAEFAKLAADKITPELRSELDAIEEGTPDLERQIRAARAAVEAEDSSVRHNANGNPGNTGGDPETRERLELRGKASLGRIFKAAVEGNRLEGADEEYRQSVGCAERSIPLDIFEREPVTEQRADAVTGVPSTTGINMQNIVPAVFNKSIAARIGIQMPRSPSGQYSVPRLTTSLTAGAKAKGADQESTAAAFTVESAKPRRISARLSLRAEDLAEVGIPGFEAALRQNLMLVLGDVLDTQIIAGDGSAPNITGLMKQLTADSDPTAAISFPSFVADIAGLLDGKWACTLAELRMVTNAVVYGKLAATFQEPKFLDKGGGQAKASGVGSQSIETAVDWATGKLGGFWCNGRMPAAASDISKCIAVRSGMMLDPDGGAAMPAVLPTWGDISISDPYTDSASATEHVTLHTLIGDKVVIRHPDAFAEVRIKTA